MANVFRILVVAEAAFFIATSALSVLLWHHYRRREPSYHGLGLAHVAGLGLSTFLIATYGGIDMIVRLGHPATWRIPYLALTFAAGNVAQAALLTFQLDARRRLRAGQ